MEDKAIEAIVSMENKKETIVEAVKKNWDSLIVSAGQVVRDWEEERQQLFVEKFAYNVCNDKNLTACFTTNQGKYSLLEALRRSLETGLEIGGKHAYLIPRKNNGITKADFSIKAEGYIALLCGGSSPIFKNIKWGKVCEEDNFKVDEAEGTIEHTHSMRRGAFMGYWVQLIHLSGEKQVFSFDKNKIEQWKSFSKTPNTAWSKWFEEMAEQACIRHAVSRFEDAKDMLAEAYENNQAYQQKDISDRAEAIFEDLQPKKPGLEEGGITPDEPIETEIIDLEDEALF